jgi:predicted phosphohydrolase
MEKQVNKKQLEVIGEVWFQRANKLRDYWHDINNPEHKRIKAFKLCYKMNIRLVFIAEIQMVSSNIDSSKFVRGGI